MTGEYCERCGRELRVRIHRWHTFDKHSGKRLNWHMVYYYCWVGRWFGRGNPHGVTHSYHTNGKYYLDK